MSAILPTRTCFDDSVENLVFYIERERPLLTNGDLLICHGVIEPEGKEIVHAWLELRGKRVIDSGILNGKKITYEADLASFYSEAKVKDVTKYKPMEAYAAEFRCKHFGPWEQKYRQRCPDIQNKKETHDGMDY